METILLPLRISGLLAFLGAFLYAIGDVLLLASKVNLAEYPKLKPFAKLLSDAEKMIVLSPNRMIWGALLGVFGTPLYVPGYWHIYQGLGGANASAVLAKKMAEEMGFNMYMVDHFCKPGYENTYNHWNWKVYIDTLAIGPGSYSYFDGYRLGTETDVEKYIKYVNEDKLLISTVTAKMSPRVREKDMSYLPCYIIQLSMIFFTKNLAPIFWMIFQKK